jgi:hypothetical protein
MSSANLSSALPARRSLPWRRIAGGFAVLLVAALLGVRFWLASRPGAIWQRGQQALEEGRRDDAEQAILDLEDGGHLDEANHLRAELQFRSRQYGLALRTLQSISDQSPLHLKAVALIGRCYLAVGRCTEAEGVFRYLHEKAPTDVDALKGLAAAHFDLGALPQALESCWKWAELEPASGPARRFEGVIYKEMQKFAEAVEPLRAALALGLPDEQRQEARRPRKSAPKRCAIWGGATRPPRSWTPCCATIPISSRRCGYGPWCISTRTSRARPRCFSKRRWCWRPAISACASTWPRPTPPWARMPRRPSSRARPPGSRKSSASSPTSPTTTCPTTIATRPCTSASPHFIPSWVCRSPPSAVGRSPTCCGRIPSVSSALGFSGATRATRRQELQDDATLRRRRKLNEEPRRSKRLDNPLTSCAAHARPVLAVTERATGNLLLQLGDPSSEPRNFARRVSTYADAGIDESNDREAE